MNVVIQATRNNNGGAAVYFKAHVFVREFSLWTSTCNVWVFWSPEVRNNVLGPLLTLIRLSFLKEDFLGRGRGSIWPYPVHLTRRTSLTSI